MDARDKFLIKTALGLLKEAGDTGLRKAAILQQIDLAAGGEPLTNDQLEEAFATLQGRGWITSYIEPVWHDRRWRLTVTGHTVLESL